VWNCTFTIFIKIPPIENLSANKALSGCEFHAQNIHGKAYIRIALDRLPGP
jgi:hypothetical protein